MPTYEAAMRVASEATWTVDAEDEAHARYLISVLGGAVEGVEDTGRLVYWEIRAIKEQAL
jgi:hypothetical protein